MRRIRLLTVLIAMLGTGLGMIVLLIRIIPSNAEARLPLMLTAGVMVIAGLVAAGVATGLARRSS